MSLIPENTFFAKDHDWVTLHEKDGNIAKVGISHQAEKDLGEIVFASVEVEVGDELAKDDVFGTVESTKSSNELLMPVSGKIIAINESLDDNAGIINESCYQKGWFIEIALSDPKELDSLMSASAYTDYLKTL